MPRPGGKRREDQESVHASLEPQRRYRVHRQASCTAGIIRFASTSPPRSLRGGLSPRRRPFALRERRMLSPAQMPADYAGGDPKLYENAIADSIGMFNADG